MNRFLNTFLKGKSLDNEEFATFDDNRVSCEPTLPHPGTTMQVNYRGLLKNAGANHIYFHYGFDHWTNISTIPMNHSDDGDFDVSIIAAGDHEINFCFKDCAGNWDNNQGSNWTIKLQQ